MSKRRKRLERIRQNPKNVSLDELRTVLEDYGFWLDRIVGSHHVFRAEIGSYVWKVVIPLKTPVKIVYVKQALEAIEQIIQLNLSEGGTNGESEG